VATNNADEHQPKRSWRLLRVLRGKFEIDDLADIEEGASLILDEIPVPPLVVKKEDPSPAVHHKNNSKDKQENSDKEGCTTASLKVNEEDFVAEQITANSTK
jgi:hypothetical protein